MKVNMTRLSILLALLSACGSPEDHTAESVPPVSQGAQDSLPDELVPDAAGRVAITVDGAGYHPATIHARVGQPLTLVFTRVSDEGCAQELSVPSLGVRRPLPLNEPVEIAVTPTADVRFSCGMDMLRGQVVVHGTAEN